MAGIYRVRTALNGWQGGPGLSTTYHGTGGTVGSAADALTVVTRVRGAWDVVKTILPSPISAQVSGVVDVLNDQDGSLVASYSVATPAVVTGTGSATVGPAQVAAGLILDTTVVSAGRRIRGHLNIGPLQQASSGLLLPPAGVITAVNAMGVALATVTPPAATGPLVVWSRPNQVHIGFSTNVLATSTAVKWFSIRSRRD